MCWCCDLGPKRWEINVCCLICQVCGVLLQQPELTETRNGTMLQWVQSWRRASRCFSVQMDLSSPRGSFWTCTIPKWFPWQLCQNFRPQFSKLDFLLKHGKIPWPSAPDARPPARCPSLQHQTEARSHLAHYLILGAFWCMAECNSGKRFSEAFFSRTHFVLSIYCLNNFKCALSLTTENDSVFIAIIWNLFHQLQGISYCNDWNTIVRRLIRRINIVLFFPIILFFSVQFL